jgi:hypothetical protein
MIQALLSNYIIPRNQTLKRGMLHWYLKIKNKNQDNEII